jgi:GDP-L-fucose synthase
MNNSSKIFIAGHKGMVGSAIHNLLIKQGYSNIIVKSKKELDLRNTDDVAVFFAEYKPEIVILAAAKVGGINANMNYPVEFLLENLTIQNNIIQQSYLKDIKKIVFLGSSCIYPKECPQPMKEEYLLTGKLEPTNEGYALAKITGLKLLEYYKKQYGLDSISLMPCNLYGPNDSFDLQHSHVLSALVKRFIDARDEKKEIVTLWGTGVARREFMHVSDLAEAMLFMIKNLDTSKFINIGWGDDISIKELAELIARKVKYEGSIEWDSTKPDGMLRKCMDVTKMRQYGFYPKITLEQGIDEMIELYQSEKYSLTTSKI